MQSFVGEKMTQEELNARAAEHQLWRTRVAGSGRFELRERALRGLSFRGRALVDSLWSSVTVVEADLTGTHLDHGQLKGVSFRSCRLAGTSFLDCVMNDVDFREAQMPRADLSELFDARRVLMQGANLRHGILRKSLVTDSNFDGADLENANLSKAELQGCSFRNANLRGADLRETEFVNVDLRGADLTGARLHETTFRRVRIHGLHGQPAEDTGIFAEEIDILAEGEARFDQPVSALRALLR